MKKNKYRSYVKTFWVRITSKMSSNDTNSWQIATLGLPNLEIWKATLVSLSMQSNECTWRIMLFINKLLAVLLLYIFIHFFVLHFVVGCLLLNLHFYILMLLLYLYLFINHVNKPIIFIFESFVYPFKNIISIFVTVF